MGMGQLFSKHRSFHPSFSTFSMNTSFQRPILLSQKVFQLFRPPFSNPKKVWGVRPVHKGSNFPGGEGGEAAGGARGDAEAMLRGSLFFF